MDAFSIWWLGLSLSRQSAGCLCHLGKPPSSCSSLRLSPVLSSRPPCRPRRKAGLLPSLLPGCPVFSFFLLLLLRAFIIPVTDSLKHHRWLSFFLFWLASHRAPDSILSALDPRCHSLSSTFALSHLDSSKLLLSESHRIHSLTVFQVIFLTWDVFVVILFLSNYSFKFKLPKYIPAQAACFHLPVMTRFLYVPK